MRPRVITANVATLDGRIAASPSLPSWRDETWRPVSEAGFDLVDVPALHGATVTLEGSNSFVAREAGAAPFREPRSADPLREDFLPARVVDRVEKWMVVPDSRGRVAWTQTEGEGMHLLVLVCGETPAGYLAFLREREIPYLFAGVGRVELDVALRRLAETFQVDVVVSTAGGVLNGALLRARLVDEIDLQILPIVLGIDRAPAIFEGYGLGSAAAPLRLSLLHQESRSDGCLFVRYAPEYGQE